MFNNNTLSGLSHRASSELLGDLDNNSFTGSFPLRTLPDYSRTNMAQPGDQVLESHKHTLQPQSPSAEDMVSEDELKGMKSPGTATFGSIRGPDRPRTAGRERAPSSASKWEPSQPPRLEFDFHEEETASQVPQRRPSRQQIMRYGPPEEYGYNDRPYWPRPPYDYGTPVRPPPSAMGDYWGEDPAHYNRPYPRRMSSVRESDEWKSVGGGGRGPPGPPRRRYTPYDDDRSEWNDDDERPLRYRVRTRGGGRGPPSKSPPPEVIMRLPFTEWMNGSAKAHFVAVLGEFMGTTMFLFFAFAGTQVANIGAGDNENQTTTNASTGFSPIVLMYISLSFGFSLMVNVWIFFRISGGLFNPAVTLAMMIVKGVGIVRGVLLIVAQLLGAIFGSYVVSVLFPTTFNVRTTLSDGTSVARGVFIEMLLTAELVFTIYMLANEKHKATFMAPVGIGLALFVAELIGVYYTGGSLNPARSFGPCVVSGVWDPEHWIYWVGPAAGAFIAWAFYRLIKMLEYEMANPGQESASKEEAAEEAEEMTPKKEVV